MSQSPVSLLAGPPGSSGSPTDLPQSLFSGGLLVWGERPHSSIREACARSRHYSWEDPPLLVDPPIHAIHDLLRSELKKAQSRCTARLVQPDDVDLRPVLEHPAGVLRRWGCGGWLHSDLFYKPACTDVHIAWAEEDGRRLVRARAVRTHRHPLPTRLRGLWLPDLGDPKQAARLWERVFPERERWTKEKELDRTFRQLSTFGRQGSDDRVSILDPHLAAFAPGVGAILTDRPERPSIVQVVVTDPATGHRHHLSVPPRFGDPASQTWKRLDTPAARVRAAVAWTFGVPARAYSPGLES